MGQQDAYDGTSLTIRNSFFSIIPLNLRRFISLSLLLIHLRNTIMGTNHVVGAKIQSIRESKQLSITDVSERSGLSSEQIRNIEEDKVFPSPY